MSFDKIFAPPHLARFALALVFLAGLSSAALAHVGIHADGFADGFGHPLSGMDHVLAMVAVGLWAAQIGRPAYWLLPLTFPVVMGLGALVGSSGIALPWIELAIAGSVVALGSVIAFALRPSTAASVAIIALFALFHGYAHGTELGDSSAAFCAGFVGATLALHAIGLAFGAWSARSTGLLGARTAGAAIAVLGAVLLIG